MSWATANLWLIPALPLLAAGLLAVTKKRQRTVAAALSIGSLALSFLLAMAAFVTTLKAGNGSEAVREFYNFAWLQMGESSVRLGWILDPLTACMLVMVTFVGLLIFIYSVGYMGHDENFTRFFCFLSLFAAAMLGLVIANSLLLLFICWELVGLASYLLIGFWFEKPSAAAAAKKAFITTRIGDVGLFLGMVWLYSETGTLLFYDNGNGCLEQSALSKLVTQTTAIGLLASTAVSLLIFCGAAGKSGQVPLHVWLPDAMEGPTPVSALIHAATMVAAGVFLVARMFPLMSAAPGNAGEISTALQVITWIGAITALFAACIAIAQTDIKRILAYSTVSQLGYMMVGLGVGGVAVGMFHLITHAFFKALLFLGAGSVIHGCHEEQDIRRMGGLKKFMPVTFATYAIGMMALSGVPIIFSGFWSKDEILHSALHWPVSRWPFALTLAGAALTAFYMSRQMFYVFYGPHRALAHEAAGRGAQHAAAISNPPPTRAGGHPSARVPHESPSAMTAPLVILAAFAILLGIAGTPAWPWFHGYLTGHGAHLDFAKLFQTETLFVMLLSTIAVAAGIWLGWRFYGMREIRNAEDPDPLEQLQPSAFNVLRNKFYIDELYELSVIRFNAWCAWLSQMLDRHLWNGAVQLISYFVLGLSWLNRFVDEYLINFGFDQGCERIRKSSAWASRLQNGQVQHYLRVIGITFAVVLILLTWGFAR